MDQLTTILLAPLDLGTISYWETVIGDYFFLISLLFLAFELLRYTVKKQLSKGLLMDTVVNFVTLGLYLGVTFFLLAALYLSAFSYFSQFAIFSIEINWATTLLCIVFADFLYYWEHRFMHRVNVAWATHAVHHSSSHFNISVAYRFGPMDAVWPFFFGVNLVLLGFNPFVVFFAEAMVQFYQTLLHTESIKKLPKPIEAVFNTPSHHRVHHGVNRQYWDKNYGGIFIIWDRLFKTFEPEVEPVKFGISEPVQSANPLFVFTFGFIRLARDLGETKGFFNKLKKIAMPPGWQASKT